MTIKKQPGIDVNEMWYREEATCSPEGRKRLIVDHENLIKVIRHRHYGQIDEVINTHIEKCEEVLLQVKGEEV